MKAVRVHEYGGPEVLTYEDVDDPAPGHGEVLVDVQVIGVNFSDTHYRRGSSRVTPLPLVPGHEGGGIVSLVGDGVTDYKPGDRVVFSGQHRLGTYKEKMVLPALSLIPVPPGIDVKKAVSVLNQGQTAHYLVHEAHPVKAGECVLIHAGAGGVGSNLVQMAKRLGARVLTTVSSEEKAAFVRELGADEAILYTQVDFAEAVNAATKGEGADVVFDAVGGEGLAQNFTCLAPKGHVVCYGNSSGRPPPLRWPARGGSYYISHHTGSDYNHPGPEAINRAHEVFRWVREGDLKFHVHREYALADATQAHIDIESRGTIGKLLLIP